MLLNNYFFGSHIGEFSSLLTAVFWTITALAFESASNKVGSLAVNFFRLFLALFFLSILNYFYRGHMFPVDADMHTWFWLCLSGLVGFVFGDFCLFKSFTLVGSNTSMLIMTIVPAVTTIIGWFFLNESLTIINILGISITMVGILIATLTKINSKSKVRTSSYVKGIFYALGGVLGQSVGLILSKFGMGNYNCFAATQIRIIAGLIGFTLIVLLFNKSNLINSVFKNKKALVGISIGSFFGPFLGVSFSLLAIQHTTTGIASTIMAIVPILIIPPSIIIFKRNISLWEVLGAVISVSGIVLFFM